MGRVLDEPCARRSLFVAFRRAAEKLWGEGGLAELGARLPEETRRAVADPLVLTEEWLPERHLVALHEVAWEGPCRRDVAELNRYLHAVMDGGFGTIQRFMLTLVTPAALFPRGRALWKHDHSHGDFHAELTADRAGTIRLRDHPYVEHALLRRSVAETFRYAGSLTRCQDIRETHHLDADGSLVVKVSWDLRT
jgi:hypothetical protein